jgi:hypothetical protein
MKTLLLSVALFSSASVLIAEPALTIYNQNFAVIRERLSLDLKAGVNAVTFSGVTAQLEPDSVVLRDLAGKTTLRILEQSYRADTLSQGLMLSLYEGKDVDFLVRDQNQKEYSVRGKVIRSGYTPGAGPNAYAQAAMQTPIVEVGGQLRFSLPGQPVFPSLADDAVLRPTLTWQLASDRAAKLDAELGYVTGGLNWQASYNLISPEKGAALDILGWVTVTNESGKIFENAALKLMAGNVNKLEPEPAGAAFRLREARMMAAMADEVRVTEKSFDEFHLYSLPRPVTLRDRETKQVEFLRATGVKAPTLYVYDGAALATYRGWDAGAARSNPEYGTQSNKKVWVMREFKNTKENGLGLPLPKGRTRFYRQDDADGRLEFTGENTIEHTPQGETVRIYTGDSFDLVGERKRTDFVLNNRQDQADEAFAITLRNRKKVPVEIRVVERLYRGVNWAIVQHTDAFEKTEAQTIEFRVTLQPDEERVVSYRVRYDWK